MKEIGYLQRVSGKGMGGREGDSGSRDVIYSSEFMCVCVCNSDS